MWLCYIVHHIFADIDVWRAHHTRAAREGAGARGALRVNLATGGQGTTTPAAALGSTRSCSTNSNSSTSSRSSNIDKSSGAHPRPLVGARAAFHLGRHAGAPRRVAAQQVVAATPPTLGRINRCSHRHPSACFLPPPRTVVPRFLHQLHRSLERAKRLPRRASRQTSGNSHVTSRISEKGELCDSTFSL
jgi:hypothetical protein